jgi:hypothetical protein
MTNKTKYIGGPKSKETKAISSRNSITHGLTARRWIDDNEQSLFDMNVKEFTVDFEPQTYIEKTLIEKMSECSVRLIRIQNTENAMFDLASSEAGHPEESIKSLDNNSDRLTQAVRDAYSENWQLDPGALVKKMVIIGEINRQNLSDISGWGYVEDNMPITRNYIIKKCTNENLSLFDFISRETDQSENVGIRLIIEGVDDSDKNMSLSIEKIAKDSHKISSSSIQKYFEKLLRSLAKDAQVQLILKELEPRIQQIKDAAIPDIQKLNLIQRYRTANEGLFSKSFRELIAIQDRRKNI